MKIWTLLYQLENNYQVLVIIKYPMLAYTKKLNRCDIKFDIKFKFVALSQTETVSLKVLFAIRQLLIKAFFDFGSFLHI